jgi:CheY-like chemotaxis protein
MISSFPPSRPTILVVDDDAAIRKMLEIALSHYGLTVLTAATREGTLEVYRQHREVISVVLMDGDGLATIPALRTINSAVRCCLMSAGSPGRGYTERELRALGVDYFFEKPFGSLSGLAGVLRCVAMTRC